MEQFQIVLNASKYAVEALETIYNENALVSNKTTYHTSKGGGFWDCMRKNAGKKIGRGMAWGALTGGAVGGVAGAAGGTVVFPGLGTTTGAVGGAIFGGAKGSIYGAIGGSIWAAADCIPEIKLDRVYVLKIDEFTLDEEITIDLDLLNIPDETDIKLIGS